MSHVLHNEKVKAIPTLVIRTRFGRCTKTYATFTSCQNAACYNTFFFLASRSCSRGFYALTDVHMDTSTKLARRGSLNRVYPQTCQTVWAITLTFWAVYLQLLKLLFRIKIIPSFKLFFKSISPVHIIFRRVRFGSVIRKVEYLKLKTLW